MSGNMTNESLIIPPLHEVLVQHKLVAARDVDIALEMSTNEQISLDQVLLNLENIDQQTLAKAIAIQYNLPFVQLHNMFLEPGLLTTISSGYAQKYNLVPISRGENSITIAVSQPLDSEKLTVFGFPAHYQILQVIAPYDEIVEAQAKLYIRYGSYETLSVNDLIASNEAEEIEPDIESEAQRATEKDSFIIQLVNKIISDAHVRGASDIHIEPYPGKEDIEVRFRIDGCCEIYQRLPYRYKYAIPSRLKWYYQHCIPTQPRRLSTAFLKWDLTHTVFRILSSLY